MSSALYRKYRPQTFAQMIGQSHIKITLQRELERGEIAHAYLFCGPRGLGKTTSARLFAKSINCLKREDGQSEPCNECDSCQDIMAGRSVDIIEIDAASNTGVDNVRENIIENSRFNPVKSKYKVFIIDEVHMLSTSAFNALLKILEEPPAHVIFILCTTEIHKLPVTIISRCQRFDFKRVTGEQLIKRLEGVVKGENKKVEDEVLHRIVLASEGCVRDAESLLSKILSLGDEVSLEQAEIVLPRTDFESIAAFVGYLAEKNSAAAIELINKLINDGFDLSVFSENLLEFLRQMLLVKTSGSLEPYGVELSEDLNKRVIDLSGKFSWEELVDLIEVFTEKNKEIKQAFIPQLPLEIAVIRVTERVFCQKPPIYNFDASTAPKTPASVARPVVAAPAPASTLVETKNIELKTAVAELVQATEAAPVAPAAVEMPVSNGSVTFEDILAKWQAVIQKLINTNFSLASLLKMGQPLRFERDVLEIAVTSAFFKGRMEANNNRPVIEQAFESELGVKVVVKGIVSANVVPIPVSLEFNEEAVRSSEQIEASASGMAGLAAGMQNAMAAAAPKLDVTEEVLAMF
jgi:DNA polymerase III subunit gamma/tau